MPKGNNHLTAEQKAVLGEVKKIPWGKISTYKLLAKKINRPQAARFVGWALNNNPRPETIPCHRVIKSNGQIGGYKLGARVKAKLLKEEGVLINRGRVVNFKKLIYK